MQQTSADETIACVGGGLIGSAWAAVFAAHGYDVRVYDPSPAAADVLREVTGRAAAVLEVAAATLEARLAFTTDLQAALRGVHFVQESAPDALDLKRPLLAEIDRLTPSTTIIASSTSDFPMSSMHGGCTHRERLLVGHPINPPYAVPLVEVVASPATSAAAVDRACAFYRSVGRTPLRLGKETTGFLANRLQMALAREALQLVARGEATIGEVDQALMNGIGPRFAAVGLFGGYLLNVRDASPERWLAHLAAIDFGASLVHAGPFPPWTAELEATIANQWRERCGDIDALRVRRDHRVAQIARLSAGAAG